MEHGEIALVADDTGNHVSATTAAGRRGADGGGGNGRVKKESWTGLLQSKCEVLGMEKELAMQRWRQQCIEMAKATEMVQTLRGSVETILEVRLFSFLFFCFFFLCSWFCGEERTGGNVRDSCKLSI
jgi:hypothetical protein